jgi:hypothetical protein
MLLGVAIRSALKMEGAVSKQMEHKKKKKYKAYRSRLVPFTVLSITMGRVNNAYITQH